jgi:hypothetical protein
MECVIWKRKLRVTLSLGKESTVNQVRLGRLKESRGKNIRYDYTVGGNSIFWKLKGNLG